MLRRPAPRWVALAASSALVLASPARPRAGATAAPRPPIERDPYYLYVTRAPEFQPVGQPTGPDRWTGWLYMPWRYRWAIGTGEAGGRFCREEGIRGAVSNAGGGPLAWFARYGLAFYNDHTAGKGALYLGLADPERLARDPRAIRPRPLDGALADELARILEKQIGALRASPLRRAYALDDETSWGVLTRPLPWRVNGDDGAYARWLSRYYGGDEPAASPAPRYVTPDDLRPELAGPLAGIDLSPLLDRMSYNDSVWADLLGELVRRANRLDPGTPCGVVGAQPPSLWGGYDYAKLMKKVQWLEPYPRGSAPEIARSLAPGIPRVETHFHDDRLGSAFDTWFAWHGFAHGGRGEIGWVDGWFADGRPRPWLADFRPTLEELGGPLGSRLAGARRWDDGIRIYYSHPSLQVSWMLDAEAHGATWPRRNDDDRLGTGHLARQAWERILTDAGLGYSFLAYDEVVARGVPAGTRALVLPACYALSDVEARRIEEFATRGGAVVADFACGLFDPHGRGRRRGALDALFGVAHDGSETRRDMFDGERGGRLWVETDQDAGFGYRRFADLFATASPRLAAGYAVAERRLPVDPGASGRRVGAGRAAYLNLSPARYLAYREEGRAGAAERRPFLAPLAAAGVVPWIAMRVRGAAGDLAPLEVVAWEKAGRTLVLILQNPLLGRTPGGTWGVEGLASRRVPVEVELAGEVSGAVDERRGRRLGRGRRFRFTFPADEAVFFSFAGPPPRAASAAAARPQGRG
jgi:hypothetical protein